MIEWWDALWKAPVIVAFAKRFQATSFSFVHHLLLGDYDQGAVQKELIIAPLMDRFQTATFAKSYW